MKDSFYCSYYMYSSYSFYVCVNIFADCLADTTATIPKLHVTPWVLQSVRSYIKTLGEH